MSDPAPLDREAFGQMPDGRLVERVWLRGANGFAAAIITLGAAVQALRVPDRHGECDDVVLGFDNAEGYAAKRSFFGATVGRYANRVGGAAFMLDGRRHQLAANEGSACLHGGAEGFDLALWTIEESGEGASPFVTLGHVSPDGDQGFPGQLTVRLSYRIVDGCALALDFEAVSDRATVVNLSHHGFFNLAGLARGGSVLGHELTIFADAFLPVDGSMIPEADAPAPVAGTPFDFRNPVAIGARIRDDHAQLRRGHGYDHCYRLPGGRTAEPRLAARVVHPASGRGFDLMTDQPGLQLYSGNWLDGSQAGKLGRSHRQSDAFCLEPQAFPDAPNRPDFPTTQLSPGAVYRHRSLFRFFAA